MGFDLEQGEVVLLEVGVHEPLQRPGVERAVRRATPSRGRSASRGPRPVRRPPPPGGRARPGSPRAAARPGGACRRLRSISSSSVTVTRYVPLLLQGMRPWISIRPGGQQVAAPGGLWGWRTVAVGPGARVTFGIDGVAAQGAGGPAGVHQVPAAADDGGGLGPGQAQTAHASLAGVVAPGSAPDLLAADLLRVSDPSTSSSASSSPISSASITMRSALLS